MVALTLEYSNLAKHQASIFKQLQAFRKEGQLCDVVVQSRDGTEHSAHKAVLCAASGDLKNMLLGSFAEAHQVQQGQPVQIAASDAVVLALLEYIYGGQLHLELEDSWELLRLADAYGFPELAEMIESNLCTALESASIATALNFLRHAGDLRDLSAKCEKKVATNFAMCIELDDFLKLSTGQLGRILRRDDLTVSHEEVVVQGLFNWFNRSKDHSAFSALLQNIDFQCLSSSNLTRLRHLCASIGLVGHDLQREVGDALEAHKKRSAANTQSDGFRPKRRCLQNWSPDLGARAQAPQKVLPRVGSMCWHDGAIYCSTYDFDTPSILRWKPGDSERQVVAGRVNGTIDLTIDLGEDCRVCLSPEGQVLVVDYHNSRLVSFENGSGNVVLSDVDVLQVCCSSSGAVYVLTHGGSAVERLVGATLHPVISSEHLPAGLQFYALHLFVTKDEVVYLSDQGKDRILRIKPGEAEPMVVGEAPNKESAELEGLFVTEDEKIYVADIGQRKVWSFHPGDAAWTEVLTCPGEMRPDAVLVEGRSLYVSMLAADDDAVESEGVYEYSLPPKLQLG